MLSSRETASPAGEPSPRVSVVCPFFNEEAIIVNACRRMMVNLKAQFGSDWELILVNDGSRDNSLTVLTDLLKRENPGSVKVMSYPVNQGRGRALKTGIDAARGNLIVTTEADCSWGDDIVARLVEALDRDPALDFVVASPHLPGGGLVNVPANRVALTRLGNWLIRKFFTSQVTMNTGMTRAYRKQVIQPLVAHENGKEFHLEILLKLLTLNFRVGEIPATITWQDHKLAEHNAPRRKSSTNIFRTINSHLRFVAIAQPVRYFAMLAALSLLIGAGFLTAAIYELLTGGPSVFFAMVGMLMLVIGLLFTGFSVLFFQLREFLREIWLQPYRGPLPPSARPGTLVFPSDTN